MAEQAEDPHGPAIEWEGPGRASKRVTWARWWGKLALELFIVFVGVSGAFALDQYRSDRDRDGLRQAIYRALDNELQQHAVTIGPRYNREASHQLNEWDQAIAQGKHPLPPTFRVPVYRAPTGVWNAAVQSQAIELIDPELFFDMARYYNRVDSNSERFERYASAAEENIWPDVGQGASAFWDAGGRLRPGVATHVLRLRNFRDQQLLNIQEASLLRNRIRAAARSL